MSRSPLRDAAATVRYVRLLACALSLTALPHVGNAESLPASVAACYSENDIHKRLSCYDREVGRFVRPQPAVAAAGGVAAGVAISDVAPKPAPSAHSVPGDEPKETKNDVAATDARHIAARVVSIEDHPDEIVLHLDNGQVWQQVQPAPADPYLRPGDAITIDKSMGSYWLSGRLGVAVKVQRRK